MTKSFKYGECLKTWETTKPLNTKSVQKQEKQQNPLNMAIRAWSKMLCAICWGPEGPDKKMLRDSRKASNDLSDFRFSNLTLIFGHISREFSFSSLMKGGPNSVTRVSQVAPLWMRRMMGKMTKARQVIRWRRQIINSGSKPRLPIDQINDCRTQHKCPDVPPSLLHWSTLCCVYFSVSCCTAVHQT